METLPRLEIVGPDGPYVFIDGDRADWFVAAEASGARRPSSVCAEADAEDARGPLGEVWLYTNNDCNLSCTHCLIEDHAERPTLDALLGRADEAITLGAKTVYLTGGEPLLRPDIADLIAALASRVTVCVLTNGTLVTSALLARLDELGAASWKERLSFQVSVDGPRAVHDTQRGSGAFDRALRGIALLADWGRPPALTTALTTPTVAHAHEVTALAAGLGCRVHHLLLPHKAGRLACADSTTPEPDALLSAVRRCRAVAEETGVILANDAALAARVRKPGRFVWCNGGSGTVALSTDGTVYPCPSLVGQADFAGTGASGVAAGLAMPQLAEFRCGSVEMRPTCSTCEYRFFCGGGCSAHAFRSGGSLSAEEPYCAVYRGLIEDHLVRESRRLLEDLEGPLGDDLVMRPSSRVGAASHHFGCT